MANSILQDKSYKFALRIVNLSKYLTSERREFSLSRKVLDSGTAIGVLIEEAKQGEDRSDFSQKLAVANKEAFKTNFWLRLRHDSEFLNKTQFSSLLSDCEELQKMLISSLKTTKRTNN